MGLCRGATLTKRLVENHSSGGRDVEGTHPSRHGDAEEVIAGFAHEVVEAGPFAAQHKDTVAGEVKLVVVGLSPFVETNDPEILSLEILESAHEVHYAGNAEMFGCAGAGFYGHRAQRGGAALGEDNAVDAGSVGHAKERAQVLRVFDAIEGKDEPGRLGAVDGRPSLEEVFDGQRLLPPNDGHNALVCGGSGKLGQLLTGLLAHAHACLAAFGDQLFQPRVLALARHHHVVKAAPPGPKSFLNRVNAVEDFHRFKCRRSEDSDCWAERHTDSEGKMNQSKAFSAVVEFVGKRPRWMIARVPFDIATAWPVRNGRRVKGTINGFAFRTALVPQKGQAHFMVVNRKMQVGAGANAGDKVRIALEPDLEDKALEMPVEFAQTLKGAKGLRKYFESISPSMQRGLTNFVADSKSVETRRKRAGQMAEALLLAMEGEQEPPPILRAAFQGQPLAEAGWKAMTPLKRRYHLLGIFYRQTATAREQRARQAIEDALRVAKRKPGRLGRANVKKPT